MISADLKRNLDALYTELREVFSGRLRSLILYGPHARHAGSPAPAKMPAADRRAHTLAMAESIAFVDLSACASRAAAWDKRRLAVPLLLTVEEFTRSLDAFPLEYGDILAHHVVVAGLDPFEGLTVKPADLRRGCEVQAKSHLIHLREGYVETHGDGTQIAELIAGSAESFATLLDNVLRLQGVIAESPDHLLRDVGAVLGLPSATVKTVVSLRKATELSAADALILFPAYLDAAHRLWQFVDRWEARP